ncbi:MAG: prepilin-type N-terminal cleavage/methylation domain-containing protein [Desulfosoma sp.]
MPGVTPSTGTIFVPCPWTGRWGGWREPPGFTLVEVLVAVVVAVVVFLAFFGVHAIGIRTRAHARLASAALNVAADFVDQVAVSAGDTVVINGEGVADSGFLENGVPTGSGAVFSRRWDIQRGVPAPHLVTVRVILCWSEPGKPLPTAVHCDFPDPAAPHVALEAVLYRP